MKNIFFNDLKYIECRYTVNSSECYTSHFHEEYSIGYVLDNDVIFKLKNKEYIINNNHLVLINPYETHSCNCIENSTRSYFMLYIKKDYLKKILKTKTPVTFKINITDNKNIIKHYLHLCNNLIDSKIDILYKQEKIEEFILMISQYLLFLSNEEYNVSLSKLYLAKRYILEHFKENLTLEQISKNSGVSKYYLIRLFKKNFGITPYEYLINLRIVAAKKLILEGLPLSQVALEVGFSDQSHLNRFFKRIVACPPGEYKKSIFYRDRT